jgi:hypothetical protein
VRERHDGSLEIGAAVVAQQHEHALKHRRVSSRLDQRPFVDQCSVGQQELDDVDGAVENRRRIAANFSSSSARSSALDCSTISKMFHGRDQLPFGPHANRVLVHCLVDDCERHKRGQFEILEADADLDGALSDEADVCRGGENLVDVARALFGTVDGVLKRQPADRWEWISVKLKRGGK